MKVSIIIPVYNVAPYIKRCLDSVAAQTYTGDMECILVDDCGKDDSVKLAKEWIDSYTGRTKFFLLSHTTNQGQSAARNTGLKAASGDYIFFLDSDDAITPECIESLASFAAKYPDVDFVQGQTVNNAQGTVVLHYIHQFPEYENNTEQMCFCILRHSMPSACNKLIKYSFITLNSLFFPVGIVHEDLYWLFFVMKRVKSVAFTNIGTYYYYTNGDSTMHDTSNTNIKKRAIGYKVSINAFVEDLLRNGAVSKYQRQYVADAILNYLQCVNTTGSVFSLFGFWTYVSMLALKYRKKFTARRMIFLFCLMPPMCILTKYHWWLWRIRHYIISHV